MLIIPTSVTFLHLTHREASEVPNNCQQHSALPKTMPTDLIGVRTDSTMR